MAHFNQDQINNATESSIIGTVVTFLIQQVLPWAIHTISGILTAITISFVVYKFNKWIKK